MATNNIAVEALPYHKTLTGGDIDVLTLSEDLRTVQLLNRNGAAEIYYTVDSENNPGVAQTGSEVLPATIAAVRINSRAGSNTVFRLTADNDVKYTISSLD